MENGGWIVALILLVMVGGINLMAFAAARGMFRSDDKSGLFNALNKTIRATQDKNSDVDELRRKVEDLKKDRKP